MGYHRDTFYEVRRAFQVGGVKALVEKTRGAQSPHPNRVESEVEEKILAYALDTSALMTAPDAPTIGQRESCVVTGGGKIVRHGSEDGR